MIRLSTELKNRWLGNGVNDSSLLELLDGGILAIYGGNGISMPATPNLAETGDLLLLITLNGATFVPDVGAGSTNGLEFDPSTAALLAKPGTAVWKGTAIASGTPRYARLYDRFYNTGLDAGDVYVRADLSVGLGSGAVRLNNLNAYVSGVTVVYCTQLDLYLPATIN